MELLNENFPFLFSSDAPGDPQALLKHAPLLIEIAILAPLCDYTPLRPSEHPHTLLQHSFIEDESSEQLEKGWVQNIVIKIGYVGTVGIDFQLT